MEDRVDLLVTVVLAAADERAAQRACDELRGHVFGRIVESADCSAEEPGCWAVTMRVPTEESAAHNVAAPLARAVRQFVRSLGSTFETPRVACEPPTAWTVVDDPEALGELVPGAERLLVEAWFGGDPYPPAPEEPEPAWPEFGPDDELPETETDTETLSAETESAPAETDASSETGAATAKPGEARSGRASAPAIPAQAGGPKTVRDQVVPELVGVAGAQSITRPGGAAESVTKVTSVNAPTGPADADGCRLSLVVDVVAERESGAEWQARAVASRITRSATLAGITAENGVLRVRMDLGDAPNSGAQTVLTAASALDRDGWSELSWEGERATTSWLAQPRPATGIVALELSAQPTPAPQPN